MAHRCGGRETQPSRRRAEGIQQRKYITRKIRIDPKAGTLVRGGHSAKGKTRGQVNNLAKAEGHLAALKKICLLVCDEHDDLKKSDRRLPQRAVDAASALLQRRERGRHQDLVLLRDHFKSGGANVDCQMTKLETIDGRIRQRIEKLERWLQDQTVDVKREQAHLDPSSNECS